MKKYVAFLRGINVGGNKLIKMDVLKKAFESMKFKNVKTLLASGNVIFEGENVDAAEIEETLEKKFKTNISVILRTIEDIQKLVDKDPFKKVKVTAGMRLYVTFTETEDIPYTLNIDDKTVDTMDALTKKLGKKITTRNWNTVLKILKK